MSNRRRLMMVKAGYKTVDLVLPSGILWGTTNIGAKSIKDYGLYFSYGNVDGHKVGEYNFDSSNYNNTSGATLTTSIPETILYDAAKANVGNEYRMPTMGDYKELIENTTQTWYSDYGSGISGVKFTSRVNPSKQIFFPSAGYTDGTTLTNGNFYRETTYLNSSKAYLANFQNGSYRYNFDYGGRTTGIPIRPVKTDKKWIRLGESTGSGYDRYEVTYINFETKIYGISYPTNSQGSSIFYNIFITNTEISDPTFDSNRNTNERQEGEALGQYNVIPYTLQYGHYVNGTWTTDTPSQYAYQLEDGTSFNQYAFYFGEGHGDYRYLNGVQKGVELNNVFVLIDKDAEMNPIRLWSNSQDSVDGTIKENIYTSGNDTSVVSIELKDHDHMMIWEKNLSVFTTTTSNVTINSFDAETSTLVITVASLGSGKTVNLKYGNHSFSVEVKPPLSALWPEIVPSTATQNQYFVYDGTVTIDGDMPMTYPIIRKTSTANQFAINGSSRSSNYKIYYYDLESNSILTHTFSNSTKLNNAVTAIGNAVVSSLSSNYNVNWTFTTQMNSSTQNVSSIVGYIKA